jgi:hypothetical protein
MARRAVGKLCPDGSAPITGCCCASTAMRGAQAANRSEIAMICAFSATDRVQDLQRDEATVQEVPGLIDDTNTACTASRKRSKRSPGAAILFEDTTCSGTGTALGELSW